MNINIDSHHCYHCGLLNSDSYKGLVVIAQQPRHMCCPGCTAVAQAIVDNGLESYYEFRTQPAQQGDELLDKTLAKLRIYDEKDLQEEFVYDLGANSEIQLTIEGISCAACGWLIEKQLSKVLGIKKITVNVGARRALVVWNSLQIKLSDILFSLKKIGYLGLPFQASHHESSYKKEQKSLLKKLGLAGLMTMQVMMFAFAHYLDLVGSLDKQTSEYFYWISLVLTTPVVFYSGSTFYISAIKAIQAKTVNMDVPITIAVIGTYLAGLAAYQNIHANVYFESICMFVFFLLISRYLEHRARYKATEISSNMLKYIPVTANKIEGNNTIISVLAKKLRIGDIVLVKTGETVPVDGVLISGTATIDESMLTGEFLPVAKSQGQTIFGGTLSKDGSFTLRVTSTLKHAMVNQILRLQEVALSNKPAVSMLVDKLSQFFVTAVLVIAFSSYAIWTYLGNDSAFWIMISILVATCPCALGLATPTALTCAMAKLNASGILLKRSDALEQIGDVTKIIFDKTGTLTNGEFSIRRSWFHPNTDNQYIMQVIASVERHSEHPIAAAFISSVTLNVENIQIIVGAGVIGTVAGEKYYIGSANLIRTTDIPKDIADATVFVVHNDTLIAAFWLDDAIKEDVPSVLQQLRHYKLSILSGDNDSNVGAVASQLNIEEYKSAVNPQQKLDYIVHQQVTGEKLVMLGDGINDAPVMSAADVSVAVGNASDLARNAADVVLMNNSLQALLVLFNTAKQTRSIIKQNILWALGYNILILPFAISGILSPWMAALGMSLSSIIVVFNSTRLTR